MLYSIIQGNVKMLLNLPERFVVSVLIKKAMNALYKGRYKKLFSNTKCLCGSALKSLLLCKEK